MYQPDNWIVVKISTDEDFIYKLLTTCSSTYLTSNSWRINSGVVSCRKEGHYYIFTGYSGSLYFCNEYNYGLDNYGLQVYKDLLDSEVVEVLPFCCWECYDWNS